MSSQPVRAGEALVTSIASILNGEMYRLNMSCETFFLNLFETTTPSATKALIVGAANAVNFAKMSRNVVTANCVVA